MKKFMLLIVILFISSIAYSQDEYFRDMGVTLSNPDFNGSLNFNNTLFVYGEGGMILQSTDKGQTWSQFSINDSMNITKMLIFNSELYGISPNNYLFKSTENGKNWIVKRFANDVNIYDIAIANGNLYCLGKNYIYLVSTDLTIKNEFEFTTDSAYYEMTAVSSKLYYSAGKGKLGIYDVIDKSNEVINLAQLGLCSDCRPPIRFIPTEEKVYFTIRFDFFALDIKTKEIKKIKGPMKSQDAAIGAYHNKLFNIYTFTDTFINNLDSLYFYSYDNTSDTWVRVDNSKYERYIWGLKFTNINFIDQNTIIAVGKDKLIYMSYDGGKNWSLKSSLTKYGFEDKFFHTGVGITASGFRFSITTDGGITWLPQKQHIKKYVDSHNSFFTNSFPFIISEDFVFTFSIPYHTQDTNITIFRNKLEKLYMQLSYTGKLQDQYPNIYEIFGRKYLIANYQGPFFKDNPKYVNAIYSSWIDIKDTLELKWQGGRAYSEFLGGGTYKDFLYMLTKDCSDSTQIQYAILKIQDTNGIFHPKYMKYETFLDFSKLTSDFYFPVKSFMYDKYLFMPVIDSLGSHLFSYDVENKEFKSILNLTTNQYQLIIKAFKLNDKHYLFVYVGKGMKLIPTIYENLNFEKDPTNWSLSNSRYVISSIEYESDSLKIVAGYDMLINPDKLKYFYLKPKTTNSVVEKLDKRSYLYISDPYPNPVDEQTTFKVYFPLNNDIKSIQITATNLLGQTIADENSFIVSSTNNYLAEIKWLVGNLPAGVYLINIKIGEFYSTKPIIIN